MNDTLSKFEDVRKKKYKNLMICIGIAVGINVIAILIAIFLQFIHILLITVIVGIFLVAIPFSQINKYMKTLKATLVVDLIKEELGPDAIYSPQGVANIREVCSLGVYQVPDRYHFEDFITASYNGIGYQMYDARFEERHVRTDSKGNVHESYVTYFFGRIIKIDYRRNLNMVLKVIEGIPNGFSSRGLERVETEVIDFNKKFKTYTSDKENVFYYLTPVLIQKMLELEKMYKGTIQYCYTPDYLYVFINNSTDSLDFSFHKKIEEKQINIIRSQITIAASIINEFGLDNSKFNEEFKI